MGYNWSIVIFISLLVTSAENECQFLSLHVCTVLHIAVMDELACISVDMH